MRFVSGRWMDEGDFKAMGPPETAVEMPGDLTLGLFIPHPFGRDTDAMLTIHAQETPDDPGGIITLAIEHRDGALDVGRHVFHRSLDRRHDIADAGEVKHVLRVLEQRVVRRKAEIGRAHV